MATAKSTERRLVALIIGAVLGIGACSADTADSSSETTGPPAPTTRLGIDDWALAMDAFIDEQNRDLGEVSATYQTQLSSQPDELDVEIEWLRANATVLNQADPPDDPDDETVRLLYHGYLESHARWAQSSLSAADALEREADAIKAAWDNGANQQRFDLAEAAYRTAEESRVACSDLADAIAARAPVSLDCAGQVGPERSTRTELSVGQVRLELIGGPPLDIRQLTPDVLVLRQPGEEQDISLVFLAAPSFANPDSLHSERIDEGGDWPDELEPWLEAAGVQVLDMTRTTIAGHEATSWQFISAEQERSAAIIGANIESENDFFLQLSPGAVITLYRIEVEGQPIMLIERGWDADLSDRVPDFFPTPEEVAEWARSVMEFIELA